MFLYPLKHIGKWGMEDYFPKKLRQLGVLALVYINTGKRPILALTSKIHK